MVARPDSLDAEDRPFVAQRVDGGTLLLTRRMYVEQTRVAEALRRRLATPLPTGAVPGDLEAALRVYLPEESAAEARAAVRLAATRTLALVAGGPGTGKTYSLTRLLAVLLTHERPEHRLVIELAAPTGKAAVRMAEAIVEGVATLAPGTVTGAALAERLRALKPKTVHRLIGLHPNGHAPHDAHRPLEADLVVVDEVSMVDLALMRRLLEAVRPDARLVLLGDRDQLASVEAGCVLADLVRGALTPEAAADNALAGCVQRFTVNRRFESAPDVALIASSLQGDASAEGVDTAVAVFTGKVHAPRETEPEARVRWLGDSADGAPTSEQLTTLVAPYCDVVGELGASGRDDRGYARRLRDLLEAAEAEEPGDLARPPTPRPALSDPAVHRALLHALERYRVLAVHRRGRLGVEGLEEALAARIRRFLEQRPDPSRTRRLPGRGPHWLGRAVLITENARELGLSNGDVGLVLPALNGQGLAVSFPLGAAQVRQVPLDRLPAHEGALAMTVHKSQGSQFAHVGLVLPARVSPILTRELVYTGVTRASNRLTWLGEPEILRAALGRRIARASGLAELLAER
jgi:exodeoxyribonuclease V alpha subunit